MPHHKSANETKTCTHLRIIRCFRPLGMKNYKGFFSYFAKLVQMLPGVICDRVCAICILMYTLSPFRRVHK